MHVCVCVSFSFSVLSQEIGWEERLRNDLLCWVGRKTTTQFNSVWLQDCGEAYTTKVHFHRHLATNW